MRMSVLCHTVLCTHHDTSRKCNSETPPPPPPRPDGTSPRVFVGVAATDFFFSDVNTYLAQG